MGKTLSPINGVEKTGFPWAEGWKHRLLLHHNGRNPFKMH